MQNNVMAQSGIGLILFGFLNVLVLDTDWWQAIDVYVYTIMFVAAMLIILSKFGWKGLFLTIRIIIFFALLIIMGLLTITALTWGSLLFMGDAPLISFFGYSSTWSTLLCCVALIGFMALICRLTGKFHWDIDREDT